MTSPADLDLIVGIIAHNGGEIVGKTRLQKTVYLLDACRLGSKMEFDYYNFGPYAADVAFATDLAVLTGKLTTEIKPGFHSVPYSIFRTNEPAPPRVGRLSASAVRGKLDILKSYSALDLEIAATLVYLQRNGYPNTADAETRKRKPVKADANRIQRAKKLIRELGI